MASRVDNTWVGGVLRNRQVVPRWHSPYRAASLGERGSKSPTRKWSPRVKHWLDQLEHIHVEEGTIRSRVDYEETKFIVNAGLDGEKANFESGQFLNKHWAKILKQDIYEPDPIIDRDLPRTTTDRKISIFRLALSNHPDQALVWSELSRQYTIAGLDEKAKRAMQCALHLSSSNTYLLRSAARMYLHFDDPDCALSVLRSYPLLRNDPRMLAAEIAISSVAKVNSKYAKQGLLILRQDSHGPLIVSELASVMGTLELENGKHKLARKLFSRSLIDPTENVLAQAQWANERDSKIVIPRSAWEIPHIHEARTLQARQMMDWDNVLKSSSAWLDDEPFSSRSAALGSFACFTEDQNNKSEAIATRALVSSPMSVFLLNNRSVVRSYLGKLFDAYQDIEKALETDDNSTRPYLVATLGLLAYRCKKRELGAYCYSNTISRFIDDDSALSAILAALYWVRETARFDPLSADSDLKFIEKSLGKIPKANTDPEITSMISYIQAKLAASSHKNAEKIERGFPELDFDYLLRKIDLPGLSETSRTSFLKRVLN